MKKTECLIVLKDKQYFKKVEHLNLIIEYDSCLPSFPV